MPHSLLRSWAGAGPAGDVSAGVTVLAVPATLRHHQRNQLARLARAQTEPVPAGTALVPSSALLSGHTSRSHTHFFYRRLAKMAVRIRWKQEVISMAEDSPGLAEPHLAGVACVAGRTATLLHQRGRTLASLRSDSRVQPDSTQHHGCAPPGCRRRPEQISSSLW